MPAIPRDRHAWLLNREYQLRQLEFEKTLNTRARRLRENGELFLGKYRGFDERRGNVLFWFPQTRPAPRKGETVYAFVPAAAYADPSRWATTTYAQVRNAAQLGAELTPRYIISEPENQGIVIGFAGASSELVKWLTPGYIVCFGPEEPPLEYLQRLHEVVTNAIDSPAAALLDTVIGSGQWNPVTLPPGPEGPLTVAAELARCGRVIVQGPPGTGKTYLLAELCAGWLRQGKRVLVTALTNRAVLEVARQSPLEIALASHAIRKTKRSEDELREAPGLLDAPTDAFTAPPAGSLLLATYFQMSRAAARQLQDGPFDVVIVEEASQAFLATIAAAQTLGENLLLIGDPAQLPPIMAATEDLAPDEPHHLRAAKFGLRTLCDHWLGAAQLLLARSHRLPARAVAHTNVFYDGRLTSVSPLPLPLGPALPHPYAALLHPEGGPVLLPIDLPQGDRAPAALLTCIRDVVAALLQAESKLNVAVLSYFRHTVRALQSAIADVPGSSQVLVDTIHRIQGLTVDVVIFAVANDLLSLPLDTAVFNVATSRAKRHTILVGPEAILTQLTAAESVTQYLTMIAATSDRS